MRGAVCVVILLVTVQAQFLLHHDSCSNRCFKKNDYTHPCQCDYDCETIGNCCGDFWTKCRGSEIGLVVTPKELNSFAQNIWDADVNRIPSSLYTLNYQGQTDNHDNTDKAPGKLIVPVDGQVDAILADHNTSYPFFINLLDNYVANINNAEHRHQHELQEEDKFWNAISQTQVMQLTFRFLVDNGFIKSDNHAFRTVMNELWFEMYQPSNQHGHQGHLQHNAVKKDSGFEHVMIGEKQHHGNHSTATGMNNWVEFYQLEKAETVDYLGYITNIQDPNLVKIRFLWGNAVSKAVPFFMGTSPEFDLALYTVCALAHTNKQCPVTINGHHLNIDTTVSKHNQVMQMQSVHPRFRVPAMSTPSAA